jgi:glycosyltransferase involved in cell wall biosynthesis
MSYHLLSARYLLGLMASALKFHADVVVVGNANHWFLLSLLPFFGVKVVSTLHCTLWPKYREPRGIHAWLRWLNGRFFRHSASAILCVSDEIARQVRGATRGRTAPNFLFVPTYGPETFAVTSPPPSPPFRVCYAGRIERDKGVFDLLEICQRFVSAGKRDIEFHLCGDGGAAEKLHRQVELAGLDDQFRLHGQLDRDSLVNVYNGSHVIVVPTTTDFVEGFNKVVLEGILSGRPVITSDVCPAVEYLQGAVITVPPDDTRAYGDAILKMAEDAGSYRERCLACRHVGDHFFDRSRSWRTAFERALSALGLIHQSDGREQARPPSWGRSAT